MHTCGSRLLHQSAYGFLNVIGSCHHKVSKLVDDDNDIGHKLVRGIVGCYSVVCAYVAHAYGLDKTKASFHLGNCPGKGACRLFGVAHNGNEKVRKSVIHVKLNLFGVDKYQLYLIGVSVVKKADDKAVDAHRLTHTRSTRDKQVGHLCNVKVYVLASYILTEGAEKA